MLDFKFFPKTADQEAHITTSLDGKPLLTTPQLNKGTAFTYQERLDFHLLGKLPIQIENLEQQVLRAYHQYNAYDTKLKKNIYLNNLHDKNQVLFYKLVSEHIEEMMPTIYTPIVGTAVKQFSQEFRQPRGLYISYPDIDHLEAILANRSNPNVDLIVVTDGEGVLGIGDQGVGAMDIPVAKLMVYSLLGGINPCKTLPICLDVGTNNKALLEDPFYLGWQHPRLQGEEYDIFVDKVIDVLKKQFKHLYLHWEDFGRANAGRFLERYQDKICTFNDDIQGTGSVAVAAILAACKATSQSLADQRIVIFGAGTAGIGIAEQILDVMVNFLGIDEKTALSHFWLIDKSGLLHSGTPHMTTGQKHFARPKSQVDLNRLDLDSIIHDVKPSVLIGCSAVTGAFTQDLVTHMADHCEHPIIFPLSNPTPKAEATPADLLHWTKGRAFVATGSPFEPVLYRDTIYPIAQCNNALVFPGIGLGILAVNARRLTNKMIWAATAALSETAPILQDSKAPLLPLLTDAKRVAMKIAEAVAEEAVDSGLADAPPTKPIAQVIQEMYWQPEYLPLVKKG